MIGKIPRLIAISMGIVSSSTAQSSPDSVEPAVAQPSHRVLNGFHLFGATLTAGYSSSLGWLGSTWNPAAKGPIFYEGASILVGYTHMDPRGALSISYTPAYSGINGMGNLQALNQRFGFGYSRRYGPKWTARLGGEA